jgi:hypothetical protein
MASGGSPRHPEHGWDLQRYDAGSRDPAAAESRDISRMWPETSCMEEAPKHRAADTRQSPRPIVPGRRMVDTACSHRGEHFSRQLRPAFISCLGDPIAFFVHIVLDHAARHFRQRLLCTRVVGRRTDNRRFGLRIQFRMATVGCVLSDGVQ